MMPQAGREDLAVDAAEGQLWTGHRPPPCMRLRTGHVAVVDNTMGQPPEYRH